VVEKVLLIRSRTPKEGIQKKQRAQATLLAGESLYRNFKEIKCGFDEDSASYEAERCMTCGSRPVIEYVDECRLCLSCERNCPVKAISNKADQINTATGKYYEFLG